MFGIGYPTVSRQWTSAVSCAAVVARGDLGLIGGGYGDRDWWPPAVRSSRRWSAGGRPGSSWSLARQPQLLDLRYVSRWRLLSFGDAVSLTPSSPPDDWSARSKRTQAEQSLGRRRCDWWLQGTEAGGHGNDPRSTLTIAPESSTWSPRELISVILRRRHRRRPGPCHALLLGAAGIGRCFYAVRHYPHRRGTRCWAAAATTCAAPLSTISCGAIWPGHDERAKQRLTRFEDTGLGILHREKPWPDIGEPLLRDFWQRQCHRRSSREAWSMPSCQPPT